MITLTFDDNLLDTYEVAFPIMEKYGVKGIAYCPTGLLTGSVKTVRTDERAYMNLRQLKELHNAGWEIGSHSVTHPRFDRLNSDETVWELKRSKMYLEGQGFEPLSFSFPYGHGYYTREQVEIALRYYRWIRTVTRKNPHHGLVYGIPIYDSPENLAGNETWKVYVLHYVKSPRKFEDWLSSLQEEVITFKDRV